MVRKPRKLPWHYSFEDLEYLKQENQESYGEK